MDSDGIVLKLVDMLIGGLGQNKFVAYIMKDLIPLMWQQVDLSRWGKNSLQLSKQIEQLIAANWIILKHVEEVWQKNNNLNRGLVRTWYYFQAVTPNLVEIIITMWCNTNKCMKVNNCTCSHAASKQQLFTLIRSPDLYHRCLAI